MVVRLLSEDLEELIQRALKPIDDDELELSIYFGQNPDERFEALAAHLFSLFESPLLKAEFGRREGEWELRAVRALGASDVPAADHDFLLQAAVDYFSGKRRRVRRRTQSRYDLAILHDPVEAEPPSDKKALERFEAAAEAVGFSVELITKEDAGRLAEFDALFIRETTAVNHHTYRFARRAEAEGLVVVDDPNSILRCTNKVYLAEVLTRQKIPCPKTLVVHADNVDDIVPTLGLPGRAEAAGQQLLERCHEGRHRSGDPRLGARHARDVGADRRAGVPADRVRLARRHLRRAAAVRLQVLHGAPALADHPARQQRHRRRRVADAGGRAKRRRTWCRPRSRRRT